MENKDVQKIAKMTSKNSLDFKSVGFPIGNEKPKANLW